jgi:hypothetical protein
MLEKVELGLSGLSVSPLCFGTGTNGYNGRSNQGDLGVERLSTCSVMPTTAASAFGTPPTATARIRM